MVTLAHWPSAVGTRSWKFPGLHMPVNANMLLTHLCTGTNTCYGHTQVTTATEVSHTQTLHDPSSMLASGLDDRVQWLDNKSFDNSFGGTTKHHHARLQALTYLHIISGTHCPTPHRSALSEGAFLHARLCGQAKRHLRPVAGWLSVRAQMAGACWLALVRAC